MFNRTFIASVISTKGGVGKTTNTANIAAFVASHNLNVLMIDTDDQASLSSYYDLSYKSNLGLYDFLVNKNTNKEEIISKTTIPNLDLISAFNLPDQTIHILRGLPDGRIRLKKLLQEITGYDLIIIDTKGSKGIFQEITILSSDLIISPIPPEKLATKEFLQGTLSLYEDLSVYQEFGFTLPAIKAFIVKMKATNHSNDMVNTIRELFEAKRESNTIFKASVLLDFIMRDIIAYYEATSLCEPLHLHSKEEALKIKELCCLLFPQWKNLFNQKHH